MDRLALGAYLNAKFRGIIAETALSVDAVLDAVEAVLSTRSDVPSAEWEKPLAHYFLLEDAVLAFATNIPVSVEGDSFGLDRQYKHAKELFDMAYAEVRWIVEPLGPDDALSGSVITVRQDFLTGASVTGGAEW